MFTNLFILSPLSQFEVFQLIGLDLSIIGQFYLALTNLSLYFILIFVTIISLHYYGNNDFNLVPNKISISIETSFASLSTMVKNQIGSLNEVYVPFIYTLFFFILFGNLISNIPYSFAVNASTISCLGFSITIFIGVTLLSLTIHKLKSNLTISSNVENEGIMFSSNDKIMELSNNFISKEYGYAQSATKLLNLEVFLFFFKFLGRNKTFK